MRTALVTLAVDGFIKVGSGGLSAMKSAVPPPPSDVFGAPRQTPHVPVPVGAVNGVGSRVSRRAMRSRVVARSRSVHSTRRSCRSHDAAAVRLRDRWRLAEPRDAHAEQWVCCILEQRWGCDPYPERRSWRDGVPPDDWPLSLPEPELRAGVMRILHPDSPWIGDHEVGDHELVVAVPREELVILAGAINEALEAVESWEFGSRLGVTPEQARALRDRLGELVRESARPPE